MKLDEQHETKQEYVKPSFRTLSLVAEEVMAIGCKLPSSGGPASGSCFLPAPCFETANVS